MALNGSLWHVRLQVSHLAPPHPSVLSIPPPMLPTPTAPLGTPVLLPSPATSMAQSATPQLSTPSEAGMQVGVLQKATVASQAGMIVKADRRAEAMQLHSCHPESDMVLLFCLAVCRLHACAPVSADLEPSLQFC